MEENVCYLFFVRKLYRDFDWFNIILLLFCIIIFYVFLIKYYRFVLMLFIGKVMCWVILINRCFGSKSIFVGWGFFMVREDMVL